MSEEAAVSCYKELCEITSKSLMRLPQQSVNRGIRDLLISLYRLKEKV